MPLHYVNYKCFTMPLPIMLLWILDYILAPFYPWPQPSAEFMSNLSCKLTAQVWYASSTEYILTGRCNWLRWTDRWADLQYCVKRL